MLELSYEYARLLLFSPFSYSAAEQPPEDDASKAYGFATQAITCSSRLVWVIEALENQGNLNPSHPHIVHALAYACVVLLHAELSSSTKYTDDPDWGDFRDASTSAHRLLANLAQSSDAAAGCLISLTVCSTPDTPPPRTNYDLQRESHPVARRKFSEIC
jgi:hypothetical protein